MSGSQPHPGRHRRANALTASAYAPLRDVDPRAVPILLQALERAGIAAYVEPTPGSVGGYLEVRLPDRPSDRLWVDPSHSTAARQIVDAELGDTAGDLAAEPAADPAAGTDEDAAWREIVAFFDRDDAPPPTSSAAMPAEAGDRREPSVVRPAPAASERDAGVRDASDHGPHPAEPDADSEPDEHFVPPPPPPLPRAQPATYLAIVAVGLGLLLVLAPALFGFLTGGSTLTIGVLLVVGGVGALIWRMHDRPPTDSGPDDGAVV